MFGKISLNLFWNYLSLNILTKILHEKIWRRDFQKSSRLKAFFFSLKIKIKQNLGCPNKEYNAIFKHIHQNIKVYSRSKKKICIDQWLGNYLILERIWAKQTIGEQVWVVPNTVGGAVGSHNPSKILQCSPSFKLGNSICSS